MSNLDRAFINAFAKHRPDGGAARRTSSTDSSGGRAGRARADSRLMRTGGPGPTAVQWRVDCPTDASEPDVSWIPAPHATFPQVQHVETYDLTDIEQARPVAAEQGDRLTLNELLDRLGDRATNWHGGAMNTMSPAAEPAPESPACADRLVEQDSSEFGFAVVGLCGSRAAAGLSGLMFVERCAAAAEQVTPAEAAGTARTTACWSATARQWEMPAGLAGLEVKTDDGLVRQLNAASSDAVVRMPDPTCIPDLDTTPDGEPILPICVPTTPEPLIESPEVNQLPPPTTPVSHDRGAVAGTTEPTRPATTREPAMTEPAMTEPVVAPLEDERTTERPVEPEPLEPLEPLAPAWEVDALSWPEMCDRLDAAAEANLSDSGRDLAQAAQDGLRVLAITSVHRREGRTTVALSLARTAARAGARVAVVDADLSNPNLARQLGVEAPTSWWEVARRQEPLAEAAVHSVRDGVTLFPLIPPDQPPPQLWDVDLFWNLVDQLAKRFDLVLLDMHPVAGWKQSANLDPGRCPIDIGLVVRNVHATTEHDAVAAAGLLQGMGIRAVGIAENFTTS